MLVCERKPVQVCEPVGFFFFFFFLAEKNCLDHNDMQRIANIFMNRI